MSKPTKLEDVRITVEHWKETAQLGLVEAEDDAANGDDAEGRIENYRGQLEAYGKVLAHIEKVRNA